MVALWNRTDHYIFALWFLLSSSSQIGCCHTSTHGVALVRISDVGLKRAARDSLKIEDTKSRQKITIWAPSHNFVGLYLRN